MEELLGCWREAQRADKVVIQLLRIRSATEAEFHDQITTVIREIESLSRLLKDLYDLFPVYRSRVPILVYYLSVSLPSLERTIKNMLVYVDNESFPPRTQWTLMMERLGDQGGISIPTRLVMYTDIFVELVRLLSRSPLYDPITLELLRIRILRLRLLQGIPALPSPALPYSGPPTSVNDESNEKRHWAEKLFTNDLHSSTLLAHRRESRCFGPPMVAVQLGILPGSSVLFKLPFDKNRISIMFYLAPEGPDVTRMLCRWLDTYSNPLTAAYGVHGLSIRRKGSSLQFRRWLPNKIHPRLCAALFFKTYERMVLFHCTFAALKSRCPLTINVTPQDLCLEGEKRLFQGKIIDDGFEHMLTVLQDVKCGAIRLHAAVRSGELRRCPVWTAFGQWPVFDDLDLRRLLIDAQVTHESASAQWLDRCSRHRIWLKSLDPYVFCQQYKKKHQMKRSGEFELCFVTEAAADAFQDMFQEDSDPDGDGVVIVRAPWYLGEVHTLIRRQVPSSNAKELSVISNRTAIGPTVQNFVPRSGPKIHDFYQYLPPQLAISVSSSQESSDEAPLNLSHPLEMETSPAKVDSLLHDSLNEDESGQESPNMIRITEWQHDINIHTATADIVSILFKACVMTFTIVFRTLRNSTQSFESSVLTSLQEEFRKFYVWNDTISSGDQDLAGTLESSKNLKCIVLTLMAQWSQALSQVPSILSGYDWTSALTKLADLEAITSEADEIAGMLRKHRDQPALDGSDGVGSDSSSDSSSVKSTGGISTILEEIKVCTECLIDLLPSLENPACDGPLDFEAFEAPLEVLPFDVGVAQPLNGFVLVMRDRFPRADAKVVRRLGDAIWRRRQRLRKTRAEIENFARTVDEPVLKPIVEVQSSGSSDFNQSEVSVGQRSRTTKSSNTAPSIFDRKDISDDLDPAEGTFGKLRHRGPVSSFRSSLVTNASKSEQRRAPVLPLAGRDGAKFECFICLKNVSDIKTQEQWKKHVFDDLEPYVCQFGDCDEAMSMFKSKREWTNHEMTKHRGLYDDLIQVSRCPLCLLDFMAPKKALYRHLGRHLRELSLASLPPVDTTKDEEVPHLLD